VNYEAQFAETTTLRSHMGDVIDAYFARPFGSGPYGGGVAAKPEELTPRQPKAPIDFTKDLQCPLLGLFGIEDKRPSPEDAKKTEEELKRLGKNYEFDTYENAGHAFFAVDRPQYRVHAAVDGWKRVFAFFGKYLKPTH
jgi:carboxymethylenebutenolidase